MAEDRLPRRLFWALLSCALLVRLLVLGVNLRHPNPVLLEPDSPDYVSEADALSHGRTPLDQQGAPSMLRPPGYSGWLAILFSLGIASPSSPVGAILVQIFLSALSVALASRLAFDLGGAKLALLTGLALSIEPSCIAFPAVLMSETLYTLGLLGALWLWRRWWVLPSPGSLAALALLIGVLPLVRPIGLYLPFLLALLIGMVGPASARRLRVVVLFLVIALIPACAWRARNFHLLGTAEFSSIGPWNKALFAHSVRSMSLEAEPGSGPWDADFARNEGISTARAMKIQNEYFRRTMLRHPLLAVKRAALNTLALAGVPNDLLVRLCLEHPPSVPPGSIGARLAWVLRLGLLAPVLLLGMVISVGGILFLPAQLIRASHLDPFRRALLVCVVSVILYHLAVSSHVQYEADRFRVPITPLLAISLILGALGTKLGGKRVGRIGAGS